MKKLKRIWIIVLILATALFIFTNTKSVTVALLLWDRDVPLILVMLLCLLIGAALGIYYARNMGKDESPPKPDAEKSPQS